MSKRFAAWIVGVAVALFSPISGEGQEPTTARFEPGMVLDGAGGWRPPTPADALRALRDDSDALRRPGVDRTEPALAVLRQRFEARPEAELNGLANALANIILTSAPEDMGDEYYAQQDAFAILSSAAMASGRGQPHPGSFDALVRVYEMIAADALAAGGADPVAEVAARGGGHYPRLLMALSWIFMTDRSGRGGEYMLHLVAASEPPELEDWPQYPYSLWCEAAHLLRTGAGAPPGENPLRSELPDIALDDAMFFQLCRRR